MINSLMFYLIFHIFKFILQWLPFNIFVGKYIFPSRTTKMLSSKSVEEVGRELSGRLCKHVDLT